MGRRLLWWCAGIGLLIHVVVVLPGTTLFLLNQERDARHALCVQAQNERQTNRDLWEFATEPDPADPDKVPNIEDAAALRVTNDRLVRLRAYAREHLKPIDC